MSSITTVLDDAGQATENVKLVYVKGESPMNPKPLDAGLAERLGKIWMDATLRDTERCDPQAGWEAVVAEVRKIVKEAKEGK